MPLKRSQRNSEPTVESPCVRNCCLDNREICLGCGRTLEEILRWGGATVEQRQQILLLAAERRRC